MKAIVDCNSFYCSCERLFQPHLDNKPVVVLSNNDGCIISRTDEAKKLGVTMAGPYFLAKPVIEQFNVATFSSNYNLYGDLSWRVMETLRMLLGEENVEVYSVDEAFLDLSKYAETGNLYTIAENILDTVEMWTGIKVSIGVAPTKVLAKVANRLSKKDKTIKCILVLDTNEKVIEALYNTPISDVWGVGKQYAEKLRDMHAIYTALDLSKRKEEWAKTHLGGVVGVRLLKELQGKCTSKMEEPLSTKKMIASTRMFGKPVNNIEDIKEAIATYTSRAAEKLRRQNCAAGIINIFIVPKEANTGAHYRHGTSVGSYITLPFATAATNELIRPALLLVDQLFEKGKHYKKAGVILTGLVPDKTIQGNLFVPQSNNNKRLLMNTVDNINFSMRDDMIKFAASGTTKNWKMRQELRSPRYTTRWAEIKEVH